MWLFIGGMIFGAILGIFMHCLVIVGKKSDEN